MHSHCSFLVPESRNLAEPGVKAERGVGWGMLDKIHFPITVRFPVRFRAYFCVFAGFP